ncbi:CaiB/BaiF CoA transferase family protein [Nocardia inohanensis]|uniref:CaiB/BaiF CoA transferase family protein n=1 Tax=Nocardia inohanensis TaxID=209246 RepID=UPI00082EA16F|nr:CaiB/BaiF CoA-transferase family protein [Nocardia inohanensis]
MGPLSGIRIVEIGGIGPGPFAAMMLADMGADLIRLDRAGAGVGVGTWNLTNRGRPSVGVDLKHPGGRDLALRLCAGADGLIEGYRPGVMERLGLGPDEVLACNPKLVYGRMTGYGQQGPLAEVAGHDVNYISVSGVLSAFAREGERPQYPLNLVGDYGGGAMMLAFGMVCGLLEARTSGRGQVVDAAMVDGSALLSTLFHGMRQAGLWQERPGTNDLDTGSHFYNVYETADGGHIAVGALEPQFYAELLRALELDPAEYPQYDRARWPELKERFAQLFRTRTRVEWSTLLEHLDACATPVYTMTEAITHPHNKSREIFVEVDGVVQPAPAPRFSRTPPRIGRPPAEPGADTDTALAAWGFDRAEISAMRATGAVY